MNKNEEWKTKEALWSGRKRKQRERRYNGQKASVDERVRGEEKSPAMGERWGMGRRKGDSRLGAVRCYAKLNSGVALHFFVSSSIFFPMIPHSFFTYENWSRQHLFFDNHGPVRLKKFWRNL